MQRRKRDPTSPLLNCDVKKNKLLQTVKDRRSGSESESDSEYAMAESVPEITKMQQSKPPPTAAAFCSDSSQHVTLDPASIQNLAVVLQAAMEPSINSVVKASVQEALQSIQDKVEALQEENVALKDENESLKSRVTTLEQLVDDQEQYSRRNCLRITGIPEMKKVPPVPPVSTVASASSEEPPSDATVEPGKPESVIIAESTDDIVLQLAKNLGVNLTIQDIDRSHRVGKPSGKARGIIVKFSTYRARQRLYSNRKRIKDLPAHKSVYLNEDLTFYRSQLLYKARQLVKDKRLDGAWSVDGSLFIRDVGGTKHRIRNVNDIESALA